MASGSVGGDAASVFYLLKSSGKVFSVKRGNITDVLTSAIQIKCLAFGGQAPEVLYGIGADLKAYVWVSEPLVPICRTVEIYQNERWTPARGYSNALLPTDRYQWSDESGRTERGKDDTQLPTSDWTWETARWQIDENFHGVLLGPEGWTYAIDFPSTYYPEKRWNHYVRRRRWTRTCRYRATNRWIPLTWTDLADVSLALMDISAGGCDTSAHSTRSIFLWAVTINGQVIVRRNCSLASAFHGDAWAYIDLPDGVEAARISVGPGEMVWAVTSNGKALMRSGINRDRPHGASWVLVEAPSTTSLLTQIAVGTESVWAVAKDGSVWFRQGMRTSQPHGTTWVHIASMSAVCVTITRNGEVFAISNDNQIYWRHGIGLGDPHGKGWKKISLKIKEESQNQETENQDPWTWISGTAGFVDARTTSFDDENAWRKNILGLLSLRFQNEMQNYEKMEPAIDRVDNDEASDAGFLKVWSNKMSTWEQCFFQVRYSQEADPADCSITVDGGTTKLLIPFFDITGICLHLDTKGDHQLQISTAFLTRAQTPLRLSGLKSELMLWNTYLAESYLSFLDVREIQKRDRLWILAAGVSCPLVSFNTSEALPSVKWLTLGGHFRSVESASGITWALGMDGRTWVWTGSYEGKTGMEKKVQVDTHRVELYENQRWNILMGFCDKLLPTDRYTWSDETGRMQLSMDAFQLPSNLWKWDSEWQIDYRNGDENGWEYAFDFPSSFHSSKGSNDYVRRRRWFRLMKVDCTGPWFPGPNTPLRSVSICPGVASGNYVSLWAVTVDGSVLVRDHVSTKNPLGDTWIPVRSPVAFVNISVGPFCVWGVGADGTAYVRNGTKDKLDGLYWFQVEKPESGANIRQVAVGGDSVWAVCTDDQAYFRKEYSAAFPEGTEWELVADGVRKISVSMEDDVYAILYSTSQKLPILAKRTGITHGNKMGVGWEYGLHAKDISCRNLERR
ncbi:tectonin beta-propeller repeat-containing protein 1-like [Paramacrobiotus metropolitanus]|uniref:tectonin beta-propeller repeat-containing protein 1-like n=1 Tax=Paramacrobiotus metropolitanus TaxID=2943436 RepID=UPI002445B468|nr:tectonin beta-propeller repeat-containing protein 1-like [Paramacrobiotus metropolitanus]